MKWTEIFETLKNYEEETRKGWFSYTWSNRNVCIAMESFPQRTYRLDLNTFGVANDTCFVEELTPSDNNPNAFYWSTVNKELPLCELPDADDYVVFDQVFKPYICMIHIRQDSESIPGPEVIFKDFQYHSASEINETHINQRALNAIKNILYKWDDAIYCRRCGLPRGEEVEVPVSQCSWCGSGYNQYTLAEFYLENINFSVCTPGNLSMQNKHRRHFGEKEWLFPYVSNGLDRDKVLYLNTSSLLQYTGDALKKKKNEIISAAKLLLSHSGITDYELIEITRPYK